MTVDRRSSSVVNQNVTGGGGDLPLDCCTGRGCRASPRRTRGRSGFAAAGPTAATSGPPPVARGTDDRPVRRRCGLRRPAAARFIVTTTTPLSFNYTPRVRQRVGGDRDVLKRDYVARRPATRYAIAKTFLDSS